MPRTGRPRVLDAIKRDAICDLVARGHTVRAAAEEIGCSPAAVFMAVRRDPAFAARLAAAQRTAQAQNLPPIRRDDWRQAARALPGVSFVLIGPADRARREFAGLANVHALGFRDYAAVPAYLHHAQVGLMPFDVARNPRGVDVLRPQKLFAYLAAGLPVVSCTWEELRGLVPRGLRQLFQRSETRIVLAAEKGGLELYEERGSQLRPLDRKERGPAPAPKVLAQLKARKWRGPIGVRVPLDSCFVRAVELPASARADFGSILSLDLERATPFRAGEVYTAHYVEDERPTGGKLKVRQHQTVYATLGKLMGNEIHALQLQTFTPEKWAEVRADLGF